MADFTRRRRYTTRRPRLGVDPGLPVGRHVFELVVEDGSGNRSKPVRVKVEILPARDPGPPRDGTPSVDPTLVDPITRGPVIR